VKRKISEGLAAADQASQDLELAKEKAVERLREAKEEAAGIIEAANRRASQIVEEAKDARRLRPSASRPRRRRRSSRRATARASSCAARSPQLSLAGAEKVLGASVDAQAHAEIVDKLAAEL
jgi:F-type H+-transporting ATPase subunit b